MGRALFSGSVRSMARAMVRLSPQKENGHTLVSEALGQPPGCSPSWRDPQTDASTPWRGTVVDEFEGRDRASRTDKLPR